MKQLTVFGISAIVSVGILFTGCATVKEARKAQKGQMEELMPGEYVVDARKAGIEEGGEYTLKQLEEIALKYNPEVLQANLNVMQAELNVKDARAGYLPGLTAGVSHNRSTANHDRHRQSTHNTGNYGGNVGMTLTLFDFGRTRAAVKQAQKRYLASVEEQRTVRISVAYTVRKAYFNLMRSFGLQEVAKEAVEQYKEHMDQMLALKEVGEGKPYDVTKAEVDYNNALLNEISCAHDVDAGWADLNLALGLAELPNYRLGKGDIRHFDDKSMDDLMESARQGDPVLATRGFEMEAASAEIDAAVAALYPSVSLSLGAAVSGHNPALPWLWQLTGAASISETIFNGGKNIRNVKSATLRLRQARSAYAAREQVLFRNLRVAMLDSIRARKQFEVSKLSEKSAKENLEIMNEKFKVGEASSVDRTDAQVSYSTARAQAVKAYFDYQESHAAIAYLIGE